MKEDFEQMTEDMIILKIQYKTMFFDKKKIGKMKKGAKQKDEAPIEFEPPKMKIMEKDLDVVKKEQQELHGQVTTVKTTLNERIKSLESEVNMNELKRIAKEGSTFKPSPPPSTTGLTSNTSPSKKQKEEISVEKKLNVTLPTASSKRTGSVPHLQE